MTGKRRELKKPHQQRSLCFQFICLQMTLSTFVIVVVVVVVVVIMSNVYFPLQLYWKNHLRALKEKIASSNLAFSDHIAGRAKVRE